MGTRLELDTLLRAKLGSDHVYFQPPASIRMVYPCIVYELDRIDGPNADDLLYLKNRRYTIKYISRNPDNDMIDKLLDIPYCMFDRRYVVENLYHDCFDLYY